MGSWLSVSLTRGKKLEGDRLREVRRGEGQGPRTSADPLRSAVSVSRLARENGRARIADLLFAVRRRSPIYSEGSSGHATLHTS